MGFSSNVDLDELLSYFLSGSIFITLSAVGQPDLVATLLGSVQPFEGTALPVVVHFVVFFGSALVLGHVFSILVRNFSRNLMNWLLGDPRQAVLPTTGRCTRRQASQEFFTEEFRQAFAGRYRTVFKTDISAVPEKAVPRLVRSHVFHSSESALQIRDRIVRARSFCANMAIALLAASFVNFSSFPIGIHLMLWAAAIMLTIKQRSLDLREAKEIYTHFLVV